MDISNTFPVALTQGGCEARSQGSIEKLPRKQLKEMVLKIQQDRQKNWSLVEDSNGPRRQTV